MSTGLKIWDENSVLVLDTNDRIVGGLVEFTTGQVNGSRSVTPDAGQSVEFVYNLPSGWLPANRRSRWPVFTRSGNTLSWGFDLGVPQNQRQAITVVAVTY